MQIRTLGGEDPLEKGVATRCSILAWRIPRDRGAIVHRVATSQIRLKRLSPHVHCLSCSTWDLVL